MVCPLSHKKGSTVPAPEAEDTALASIAAVRGGNRRHGGRSRGRGGTRGGQRSQPAADAAPAAMDVSASLQPILLPQTLPGPLPDSVHWVYPDKVGAGQVCHHLILGKLGRQGRLYVVVPGSLVHLVDQLSNSHFLVDTGTSYSIVPHQSSSPPSGPRLRSAAGQLIPCWGEKTITLTLHGVFSSLPCHSPSLE